MYQFLVGVWGLEFHVYNLLVSMGPYSLPLGYACSHNLMCCFTKDGLSRTFPCSGTADQHESVVIPLTLRGHSLGQSKSLDHSQLGLLMFLAIFHLVVVYLESKHHAISNVTLMVVNISHCMIPPRSALSSPKFSTFRQHLPNIGI